MSNYIHDAPENWKFFFTGEEVEADELKETVVKVAPPRPQMDIGQAAAVAVFVLILFGS